MEENKLKEFFLARFDKIFVEFVNAKINDSIHANQYEAILCEFLMTFRYAHILPDGVSFSDVISCIMF